MRGFFPGRFQPFHDGHFAFVKHVIQSVDELVVGVGSAQASHTAENPFTAGERISMIHATLDPLETTTYVIPIEDIDRYALWTAHVTALCPPFERVYTNNPLVRRVCREAGLTVGDVRLFDRDRYRGTLIRERMRAGDQWRDLVPESVEAVIEEIDGISRLQAVAEDDISESPGP